MHFCTKKSSFAPGCTGQDRVLGRGRRLGHGASPSARAAPSPPRRRWAAAPGNSGHSLAEAELPGHAEHGGSWS